MKKIKRTEENNGYGRVYRNETYVIYRCPCYLRTKPIWHKVNLKTRKSRFYDKLSVARIDIDAFNNDSEKIY